MRTMYVISLQCNPDLLHNVHSWCIVFSNLLALQAFRKPTNVSGKRDIKMGSIGYNEEQDRAANVSLHSDSIQDWP